MYLFIYFFIFVVLGIKSRTLHMLSKFFYHAPSPLGLLFWKEIIRRYSNWKAILTVSRYELKAVLCVSACVCSCVPESASVCVQMCIWFILFCFWDCNSGWYWTCYVTQAWNSFFFCRNLLLAEITEKYYQKAKWSCWDELDCVALWKLGTWGLILFIVKQAGAVKPTSRALVGYEESPEFHP